ncbi:MAG: ExbD/TolR family protein [bacterium]
MAFKRREEFRDFELIGLIDIVFLLLIFFLVSFAFSLAGNISESDVSLERDLPETNTQLSVISEDWLDNLLIEILDDSTEKFTSKMAYVMSPSFNKNVRITRNKAFETAKRESTFAVFPQNYMMLPYEKFAAIQPCTLIANSITRYVTKSIMQSSNVHPIVEVRAEKNTEFRILSFIMDQCSAHKDTIPQFILRTTL